jgi:HAD superfamily hydrolase (TIGR01549 family)
VKYLHFFWDFDGTLYDTYGRITRACVKALADLGIAASFEAVYPQAKRSLGVCARAFAVPRGWKEEDFSARYRQYAEAEGPDSIRPYAGAREMLEAVIRGGGQNYLYTHRGLSALKWLAHDHLDGYFLDAVTKENGFPLKPAPDALNYLIEKHGLNRAECIMLGDRDIDLDSGKNAGMACALFDPENYYPDYDTPYRFRDMAALRRALTEDGGPAAG